MYLTRTKLKVYTAGPLSTNLTQFTYAHNIIFFKRRNRFYFSIYQLSKAIFGRNQERKKLKEKNNIYIYIYVIWYVNIKK